MISYWLYSDKYKIPIYITDKINNQKYFLLFKKLKPDLIASLYWRRIIDYKIINTAKKGAINIHYALLPKYRGFASLNWAIINNEKEAGVTLHYLAKEVDNGDIVAQQSFEIKETDTIRDLFVKADKIALELVRSYIPLIEKNKAPRIKQDENNALYSFARTPEDGKTKDENKN